MTLEAILWAIPIVSLTAAGAVIGLRIRRVTRESLMKRALLARAGRVALLSTAKEPAPATVVEFGRPPSRKVPPELSRMPEIRLSKARLIPVPAIVCRTTRGRAALAG